MSLLERRRSGQPAGSIDACQLATLLTRSYRIQDLGESPDGYVRSWRPVPSAGGRHPFELLVAVRHVTDLAPGWWWFDPTSGELVSTTLDADHELYLSHASSTTANARPGAAVVCVAVWERTLARYPLGGSLVWRDAGALQAILQLVAADLAMSSRIVAGCGLIGDALPDGQVDVGAILLGSEPPRANQPE